MLTTGAGGNGFTVRTRVIRPPKVNSGSASPSTQNDEFAVPAQEFVDAGVFAVSAVGKVQPGLLLAHAHAGHFLEQVLKPRTLRQDRRVLGLPDPEAEANVQNVSSGASNGALHELRR